MKNIIILMLLLVSLSSCEQTKIRLRKKESKDSVVKNEPVRKDSSVTQVK